MDIDGYWPGFSQENILPLLGAFSSCVITAAK